MTALKNESPQKHTISQEALNRLEILLGEKKFVELEAHCLDLLNIDPSKFSLYHILGLSQSGQQKYEDAILSYRKFLEKRPDYADSLINLGVALNKTGDVDAALASLHDAIKLMPDNPVIHDIVGDIYSATGNAEKALKYLEKAIQLSPNNANYLNRYGTVLHNLGQQQKAEAAFRKAISLNKGFGGAYRNLGVVLRSMGRLDEAIQCLVIAAKLTPNDAEVYNNLGAVYFLQGKYNDAVLWHKQTLTVAPDNEVAFGNMAAAYYRNGQLSEALACCEKSLSINPDQEWVLVNLSEILAIMKKDHEISDQLLSHIIRCFQMPRIESLSVSHTAMALLRKLPGFGADDQVVTLDTIEAMSERHFELLCLLVSETVVPQMQFEAILVRFRKMLLYKFAKEGEFSERESKLLEALAYQGSKNEYLWWQSSLELEALEPLQAELFRAIEEGLDVDERLLFLVGCYVQLSSDEIISRWGREEYEKDRESRKGTFIRRMIIEPIAYREAIKDIPQLTSVDDHVSRAVQGQYEQNPYPSWDSLSAGGPKVYTEKIRLGILPNCPELVTDTNTPSILIAGCGTGKHAIMTALENRNSNVLALDLSYTSLGYAKWSADRFGVENIRFGQGDLLKLDEIGEEFDVIESVGVLHHMSEPEAGLKSLLKYLKPNGYLRLGLYSDISRELIAFLRENTDIDDVELSPKGIREYRHTLQLHMPNLYRRISGSKDFYTVSALRDLILHVQEHRFTLPRLEKFLKDGELEFLGFVMRDSQAKLSYVEKFPDDPDCLSFDNWHIYEQENPRTFGNMYQFWCRKLH